MRLWISMIVKNEASCLGACLESVKDADGILVVDTGSTDDTPDIAKRYTPHVSVGEYTWCDHFADARNFALDCIEEVDAEDYWVLSIDADETLEPGGIQRIREAISASPLARALSVTMQADGSGDSFTYPRLFRKGVFWKGVGHEAPDAPSQGPANVTITFGYSEAHKQDPERMFRTMTKAVEVERSPRNLYYLAREYWYRKNYTVAVMLFQEVTLKSQWKPERADAYLYISRCFWALSRGDDAREACAQALLINSNFKEACLFMAELSWDYNAPQWRGMAATADNRNVLFVRST
jgi:glycosyltransferase involved in cell wall biosynthesis